jgi:hypothetical protein
VILDNGGKNSKNNTFTNKFNVWTANNTHHDQEFLIEDDEEYRPKINI